MCIGTASIAHSTIATAEALFWRAIVASAIEARTTRLDTRSKGVAFARTNRVQRFKLSDANILVQEMATTEFWIKVAFILVFGGAWFACYRAATKAEHDGNRRRAIIFGIASIAVAITGFVIEDQFDIFSDDDDDDDNDDDGVN